MNKAQELISEVNPLGIAQASKGNVSLHLPAQIDDALGKAFSQLATLKLEFDNMNEVPNSFSAMEKQVHKAMEAVRKARQETTQLRGVTQKAGKR